MLTDISLLDITTGTIERGQPKRGPGEGGTLGRNSGKGGASRRDPVEPSSLLPLPTSAFHILLALRDEEKHGYAIMRDVEALSGGAVRIGPGTMYGSIKRMLKEGLIEESDERPDPEMDDERRRYYRCSALGERVCQAEVHRLTQLLRNAFPGRTVPGFGSA